MKVKDVELINTLSEQSEIEVNPLENPALQRAEEPC